MVNETKQAGSSVTTLYLVRHGQTKSNLDRRFQGTRDIPLDEKGHYQGDLLGQAMKDFPVDAVYTSPLSRARETAEEIAKYHPGIPVIPCKALEEIHAGIIEGELLDEIPKKFPDTFRCMSIDIGHLRYPGGESAREVYDRVAGAIGDIVEANRGKTIVVVSHGFSIQTYLHYASGKPFEEMKPMILANTSYCKFTYKEGSVEPVTEYLNRHDHLAEEDLTHFTLLKWEGDPEQKEE